MKTNIDYGWEIIVFDMKSMMKILCSRFCSVNIAEKSTKIAPELLSLDPTATFIFRIRL